MPKLLSKLLITMYWTMQLRAIAHLTITVYFVAAEIGRRPVGDRRL